MNSIHAIGSNGSGQLGIGHREDVSVPKPVVFHPKPPTSNIVKIAAGGNHTLILTKSGNVYWSGDPTSGACGVSSGPVSTPVFQRVRFSNDNALELDVCLMAATWEASFVVAKDDQGKQTRLFSFGIGQKGELGVGELVVRTPSATLFQDFPPAGTEIVDLAACMGHVVAVLSNGEAYGWGNCRKSQIGEPSGVINSPRKVSGVNFPICRVVCGKEASCFFGDPESGNIHVLGSDKWNLRSDAPSSASPWRNVGASWGNIYILTQEGRLEAWGRDDHGQMPPPNLPKLKSIAVGSEHVVAQSESGDVLAWGWGEHGNCGPKVENNDVKGRWNVIASSKYIPTEARIDAIGAGCATSWVCVVSD
jgi:protein ATS1